MRIPNMLPARELRHQAPRHTHRRSDFWHSIAEDVDRLRQRYFSIKQNSERYAEHRKRISERAAVTRGADGREPTRSRDPLTRGLVRSYRWLRYERRPAAHKPANRMDEALYATPFLVVVN